MSAQWNLETVINDCRFSNYSRAKVKINKLPKGHTRNELLEYVNILELGNFEELNDIQNDSVRSNPSTLSLLNEGLRYYLHKGDEIKAFNTLKSGLEVAIFEKDSIMVCEVSKIILEIYERFNQEINDESYRYFLNIHKEYAYDEIELNLNKYFEYRIVQRYFFKTPEKIKIYYNKANSQIKNQNPPFLEARLHITNSAYHQLVTKNLDSSIYFLKKAKNLIKGMDGYFEKERRTAIEINFTVLDFLNGKPSKALEDIINIQIPNEDYLFKLLKKYISFWKYQYKLNLGNELGGLRDYKTYLEDELKHNQAKKLQIISEFETKYQTAEKERQILEEREKTRSNRNWLIAATLTLFFGLGLAVLLQKNATKKRKLAEKETQLEQQKVETLLKEQELVSIDAMIAGQEKERQKVANELHDDLGSLMATVKLHFDNVKVDQKDPALKSAQKLLDDAYQKIRGIAHTKNSGVMANLGLLPAVKKMAKTINETNALKLSVEDFGLNERMENSLELTIFRIVQELIANIIKHADASKASIQFTQHADNLNIIVEDNGNGFETSAIEHVSNGMGLGTIEKRIEHLEGNFTIDSIIGKGTSILIDIPI